MIHRLLFWFIIIRTGRGKEGRITRACAEIVLPYCSDTHSDVSNSERCFSKAHRRRKIESTRSFNAKNGQFRQ